LTTYNYQNLKADHNSICYYTQILFYIRQIKKRLEPSHNYVTFIICLFTHYRWRSINQEGVRIPLTNPYRYACPKPGTGFPTQFHQDQQINKQHHLSPQIIVNSDGQQFHQYQQINKQHHLSPQIIVNSDGQQFHQYQQINKQHHLSPQIIVTRDGQQFHQLDHHCLQ
jgi:hypothetical protein